MNRKEIKEFLETLHFHGYIDHDITKLDNLINDYYPKQSDKVDVVDCCHDMGASYINKTIKNEQEFQDFCTEVRNRQYEVDPIKVHIDWLGDNNIRFSPTSTYDWDNQYLEILRIDNVDVIKLRLYMW